MKSFCNLIGLIVEQHVFKILTNPYVLLTNKPNLFQNSTVFETGLSGFHSLTFNESKLRFQKQKTKINTFHN